MDKKNEPVPPLPLPNREWFPRMVCIGCANHAVVIYSVWLMVLPMWSISSWSPTISRLRFYLPVISLLNSILNRAKSEGRQILSVAMPQLGIVSCQKKCYLNTISGSTINYGLLPCRSSPTLLTGILAVDGITDFTQHLCRRSTDLNGRLYVNKKIHQISGTLQVDRSPISIVHFLSTIWARLSERNFRSRFLCHV